MLRRYELGLGNNVKNDGSPTFLVYLRLPSHPHMLAKEFEEHSDCDGAGFMSLYPITRFVPLPNILIHSSVPCCKVSIAIFFRVLCEDFLLVSLVSDFLCPS